MNLLNLWRRLTNTRPGDRWTCDWCDRENRRNPTATCKWCGKPGGRQAEQGDE